MNTKIVRFGVTGAIATGVHALVAAAFVNLVAPIPTLANGVAFAVATVFSYVLNTLWSFGQPLRGRTLLRFVVVALIGCALAVGVSGAMERAGFNYLAGILAVVAVVPPVTFVLHGLWTYR